MSILDKLDKQITEQSRNGRQRIYIDKEDLRELGKEVEGEGREYIDKSELLNLIVKYRRKQFKNNLVVRDIKARAEDFEKRYGNEREKER